MDCVVWTMNSRGSIAIIKELMTKGVDFHQIKVKKSGFTKEHIRTLLKFSLDGFDSLISRKTNAWHHLEKDFDELRTQEVIDIISKQPEIMKFPILFDGNGIYQGNEIVEYIADISNIVNEQECNVTQIKEK